MDNTLLYKKLSSLPDDLKKEVLNFIEFLSAKKAKNKQSDNKKNKPVFGSGKGLFKMKSDFDSPLDDFKEYTN